MKQNPADVLLLTESRYENPVNPDWYVRNILSEDRLLVAALERRGLSAARVDWARQGVDWGAARCAVFRTTWDYFDRYDEFCAWRKRVQSETLLVNSPSIVDWNIDKHYLLDLEAKGVAIVPTQFYAAGSAASLEDAFVACAANEAVLKPCVSGAARHTYRLDRHSVPRYEAIFADLLGNESLMLQPFQHDIVRHGEATLVMFGGRYSHALLKRAKSGDFRVQDDFGGTVHDYRPTASEIALAEQAMSVAPEVPVYGRVDMVRESGAVGPMVMELELVEPELWIRRCPNAAERFADEIVFHLSARGR